MPPALSPSSRVRSRTSDISDFLRGKSDPKASTPPVPHLPEHVSPTKNKSKFEFAFLGRKRKPSFTPSNAKTEAVAAAQSRGAHRGNDSQSGPPVLAIDGHQPSAGSIGHLSPRRTLPDLPPVNVAPSKIPISPSESYKPSRATLSSITPHQAAPSALLHHVRKDKGSFESSRRSNESRSMRPIITVSPPHNNIHEGEGAYTTPRTAPSPSRISSSQSKELALPTPTPSDRTATSTSPTSADIPSLSSASTAPSSHCVDAPLPVASSYKEESLLRRDHFGIDTSVSPPRRGTVSFNSPAKLLPATVGPSFSPSRQERRHVSVVQLNKLKKEIVATAPMIRKKSSEPTPAEKSSSSTPTSTARGSSILVRSNTVAVSPAHSPQGSQASTSQGRRVPPPLKRTWHTPPRQGPPKEPLPSPPASATRVAQTPTTSESFRTTSSSPVVSPISSRRPLPSLLLSRDRDSVLPSRMQGTTSPAPSSNMSIPPSPSRSEADFDVPVIKTPVREDPAQRALADEHASREQLREALKLQTEKYSRLSAYLLSLTERHAVEKAELMRKVESLEQDAAKRECEMKGLKWLVTNDGRNSARTTVKSPAPEDSGVLPGSHAKAGDQATTRRVGSIGTEGRVSFDSPAGSIEDGLVELQTSISEFISPSALPSSLESPPPQEQHSVQESSLSTSPGTKPGSVRTRLRRSNTVPDGISGVPHISLPVPSQTHSETADQPEPSKQSAKAARRTSSPVLPSIVTPVRKADLRRPSVSVSSQNRTGLGLGVGAAHDVLPVRTISRSPSPDPGGRDIHARSDSSTLSSLPSLSTIHSSSSGLSSIPETPRTDLATLDDDGSKDIHRGIHGNPKRLSSSSASSSTSGSSSKASVSPSIGQVLDRTRAKVTHQPEMEAILRKLRAFGHGYSP